MAFQKNHRRPASQFEVAMAEAQHREALAGYWPQVNVRAGYQRLDQPMDFVFPGGAMQIPAQSISLPSGTSLVTIPANAFGPGFPPATVQLPVNYPGQNINTPAQTFNIPRQDVTVLDRDLISGSASMQWLVYDGGMRKGLRQQSGGWLDMMRQESRRTDLEISDDVKRYYWGAVLSRQLLQVGNDTVARMEATLRLTENMYKEGSGKVTKADYLDNSIMVDSLRAMVAQLEKNQTMSEAALANAVGLPATASVRPSSSDIPFQAYAGNFEELMASSYEFNPDWAKLEAAIRASEGSVTTAKSGYYPKLALTGELHRWWNGGYNGGLSTDQNRAGWTLGVGVDFPLFEGFLTKNKVSEMTARLNRLKETRFVLREGLGLQIKDVITGLAAAAKSYESTRRAMQSAQENRDLNERAYQSELVETEKVVRAQLEEALMSALHYKASYDYVALLSQLNLVVGKELRDALNGPVK
jgi:outer membrane protein